MTLSETIKAIELVAGGQPDVAMIVRNDIFRLNSLSDARYGVFGWTQGQHSEGTGSDLVTYAFTFFYVDRLTEDKGNEIEVQSVGIQTLGNIIRALDDRGLFASDWTYTTFNQRFLDECAGVFTSVSFQVPLAANCAELFGDFNNDFNDDFYVV